MLPSVSIVLVNFNGVEHLGPCLDSLAALAYPADRVETIVVDNGSRDGSLDLLASRYPWVKVLPQGRNLGFSPAVNVGAQAATGELLVLVNNDMRVDAGWLSALVDAYDPIQGVACVAGLILDWEGERLDFGRSTINYHGFGQQQGFGRPLAEALADGTVVDGAELPFACGGSMLVGRDTFLDLGGFDPGFFAYFEDVDFGWRLMVCGLRTRLAAGARSYHRHHGTSSRFGMHERILLLERNALRALVKNVGDEALPRLLSAALLVQAKRAEHDSHSDRRSYDIGTGAADFEPIHRLAVARHHATLDVLADLDALMAERTRIQSRRHATDRQVFARFGHPFEPLGNDTPAYAHTFDAVARFLNLGELFDASPARRVVVLASSDVIGSRMAGTAIRAWELARALGSHARVVLASPTAVDRADPLVDVVVYEDELALHRLVESADAVLVFGFDLRRYPFLRHTHALLVVDLYDPWIFGSLEQYDQLTWDQAEGAKAHEIDTLNTLMDAGDFFICASERQRDFWIGMLASRGRLDKVAHDQDAHLRKLVDVVPFGCAEQPPQPFRTPVLKGGPYGGIGPDDLVIVWSGGTWDWFDPIGVVEAFVRVHAQEPRARLYFMGLELEGRGVPEMGTTRRLVERVQELGLGAPGRHDGPVVFGPWVPYDDRGAYLLEADVGVVAAKAMAESRLAFRTRMLDHFWAGLPTVATAGDVLAELVAAEGAGVVVPANDTEALTGALLALLQDDARRARCAAAAAALADRYRWSKVVAPLAELVDDPWPWRAARAQRRRDGVGGGGGTTFGGHGSGGANAAEIARLREELADTKKHLALARRKLDVLNKTPIYPVYKKIQAWRSRRGAGPA